MPTRKFNPLTPPFDLTADNVSDLVDHTKAVHDALGIDAHTVDGKHASDFVSSTSSIKGKATIPAGSVSVVVYHELGSIPTVFITPYHIDAVQGYVDETTITSTQFTIYIPVKQLSNVSFGYEAKI